MSNHINSTLTLTGGLFPYAKFTKIVGAPTYHAIRKIQKEATANASSVPCNLSNGQMGHFGLVHDAATVAIVAPNLPYIRPEAPAAPNYTGMTASQIATAREAFDAECRAFADVNLIEATLKRQINESMEDKYLTGMVNPHTGVFTQTIPEIFATLYRKYANIHAQAVTEKKQKVESIQYMHSEPVLTIFHEVQEFGEYAKASGASMSGTQLIDIATIILQRANIFTSDFRKWNAKPAEEKTWANYRTHFDTAQDSIKKAVPTQTVSDLGYHQSANFATDLPTNPTLSHEELVNGVYNRIAQESANSAAQDAAMAAAQAEEQQMQATLHATAQQSQQMMQQMNALVNSVSSLQSRFNNQQPPNRQPYQAPQQQYQAPQQQYQAPHQQQYQPPQQYQQQQQYQGGRGGYGGRGGGRGRNRGGRGRGRGGNRNSYFNTVQQQPARMQQQQFQPQYQQYNQQQQYNNQAQQRQKFEGPQYCWTHGNCKHPGWACENRAIGHQAQASFANTMKGNEYACYWMPSQQQQPQN